MLTKRLFIIFLLALTCLNACKRRDLDDEEKAKVKEPGRDILAANGSLHIFQLGDFLFDRSIDIRKEKINASFANYTPSSTDEEPRFDDEDPTPNWLGYSEESWDEEHLTWSSNENPLQLSPYNKARPYRLIKNGQIQAELSDKYNRPIYENIDENIYERMFGSWQQEGLRFVWDFGRYDEVKTERDLSLDYMDRYTTLYGYEFLPEVQIWSKLDHENLQFSQDAKVFAATRSVERDVYIIESLRVGNYYDLSPALISDNASSLGEILSHYQEGGQFLEYQFIIDYIEEYKLYLQFDSHRDIALLYDNNKNFIAKAQLHIDSDRNLAVINTNNLTSKDLHTLNLPGYFYPIITGPFAGKVYYGKFYPKTTEENRTLLRPTFFLNSIAKDDIKTAIMRWRDQEHADRWDKVVK